MCAIRACRQKHRDENEDRHTESNHVFMLTVISARIQTRHITSMLHCQNVITITRFSYDHIQFILIFQIKCIPLPEVWCVLWLGWIVWVNYARLWYHWIRSKMHENENWNFSLSWMHISLFCLFEWKLVSKNFVVCKVDWHLLLIQDKQQSVRSEIWELKTVCENGHGALFSR